MDEIHAVLELFVSCRGSGWPLVRIEAEQQLLTQHLLMAAPMDKEEIADMIKRCFEADNNGEINFLSFWAGMENLLELLGLRDPSSCVDDKVYGLQVFRDGLLAEAVRKHQGPTSSVLLTRDEVLRIIDQTNKSVSSRSRDGPHDEMSAQKGNDTDGKACSSSQFWDEVYKETEQLQPTSVLSISELSMMVFGFLKTYIQEGHPVGRSSEQGSQDGGEREAQRVLDQAVRPTTSAGSSVVSEGEYTAEMVPQSSSGSIALRGQQEGNYLKHRSQNVSREVWKGSNPSSPENAVAASALQLQGSGEQEHFQSPFQERPRLSNSAPSRAEVTLMEGEGGLGDSSCQEGIRGSSPTDDATFKPFAIDSENPSEQLRKMLLVAGKIMEDGPLSKKDVQKLRYLNAAAVDCVDRLSIEHEKRNDEVNDAVLSLRRMQTEKQQLAERLKDLEHEHSQLQLQQEHQEYYREHADQLQAALNSERLERDRMKRLLRNKEEELQHVTQEKESLLEQMASQSDDFTRRLAASQKELIDLKADYCKQIETLTREKEALEEQLQSAEDAARAADAARQKQHGDTHNLTSALRQRILELEEDRKRHETEAEENDALIVQLQGRLEEKVQQLTILEVKNKQQLRLLQQVRGVRNSLLQLLQDTKESNGDSSSSSASSASGMEMEHNNQEVMKLKAGMKAAQAHIKELESFIEEMRKEQRRAVHPRYELSAAAVDSSGFSPQRLQITQEPSMPFRALRTLGAELEMSESLSLPESIRKFPSSSSAARPSKPIESLASEEPVQRRDDGPKLSSEESKAKAGSLKQHMEAVDDNSEAKEQPAPFTVLHSKEENMKAEAQLPADRRVGGAEPCDVRGRRYAERGPDSGATSSFASLHSEPSTTDAISKEPTSCTSLAEVEDIFDPLDLLNVDDLPDTGTLQNMARKGRRARSSHAVERTNPVDLPTCSPAKSSQAQLSRCSVASTGTVPSSELPSPDAPSSSGHPHDQSGLEILLGGKRRLSRRTSSSSTEQQRASAASSSVFPLAVPESAPAEPATRSSLEINVLSDPRGSAASGESFFMHSTPCELSKSAVEASYRSMGERSYRHAKEVATRPVDTGTLSDMFSMLGACAPLTGNPADRALRPTDKGDKMSRRLGNFEEHQRDGGKSSPKGRSKQPTLLAAAAAAAISSKDANLFRPLRRISQGSVHRDERLADGDSSPSTPSSRGLGALTPKRIYLSDHLNSTKEPAQTPAIDSRARRTVSLGFTETVASHASSAEQKRKPSPLKSSARADRCLKQSARSGQRGHDRIGEPTDRLGSPISGQSASKESTDTQEESVFSEMERARSFRRSKAEGVKTRKASIGTQACRGGASANNKRTPRSRSSSSDSPLRRELSSREGSTGQRQHDLQKSNETSQTKGTSHRREGQGTSKSSQRSRSGELMAERQQPPSTSGRSESHDVPNIEKRMQADTEEELPGCENVKCSFGASRIRSPEQRAKPSQHLQQVLGEECVKPQDEQAVSAAALLAAAAGVVDASLQQQQQMIQRQQEHHEDLQRAQQRRIDLLQEQLAVLQRSKDQQRELGEQQQKRMIEALQTKLEELQRRQEQRDQDFQESQRKLLQQELEVQLMQKFEELRCSSRNPIFEAAGACSPKQEGLSAIRAHRLSTDLRSDQRGESAYSRTTGSPSKSGIVFHRETNLHTSAQQEQDWNSVSELHPSCSTVSQKAAGGRVAHVSQAQLSTRHEEDTPRTVPWPCGGKEHVRGAGRPDAHRSTANVFDRHLIGPSGRRTVEKMDRSCDSDGTSSCASSGILGNPCGGASTVEDMPATSNSTFISQATTPGARLSLASQHAGHFSTGQKLERQMYALRGERLAPQITQARSVDHRQSCLRNQSTESVLGSHQHIPIPVSHTEPLIPAHVVQRTTSSTGSLWSPKASKRQPSGFVEHTGSGGATSGTRSHADLLNNYNIGSISPLAGSQETLLYGELRYRTGGGSRHPPDPDRRSRETKTGLGKPLLTTYHPVSRAERTFPAPQTPLDSARFLGSSGTTEKSAYWSETSRRTQGLAPSHEPQLKAPLTSARSFSSTASYATTLGPMMSSTQTSRIPQRARGGSECSGPSGDFLAMTTPRSTTSVCHTDFRVSQATNTKRSGHSRCSENQAPVLPNQPRSHLAGRRTRSPTGITGRESLMCGSRRTVNSLMNKLSRATSSEFQSPRQGETLASCSTGVDTPASVPREAFKGERFENSEGAAARYRREKISETVPDAELPHPPAQHRRHKPRHSSSRKSKSDFGTQQDEGEEADKSAKPDSSSSISMDWAGFNGGFISQVQKWIN